MKITINYEPEETVLFHKGEFVVNREESTIVLCTGEYNKDRFTGIVVSLREQGYYSPNFSKADFKKFHGTITINTEE